MYKLKCSCKCYNKFLAQLCQLMNNYFKAMTVINIGVFGWINIEFPQTSMHPS